MLLHILLHLILTCTAEPQKEHDGVIKQAKGLAFEAQTNTTASETFQYAS